MTHRARSRSASQRPSSSSSFPSSSCSGFGFADATARCSYASRQERRVAAPPHRLPSCDSRDRVKGAVASSARVLRPLPETSRRCFHCVTVDVRRHRLAIRLLFAFPPSFNPFPTFFFFFQRAFSALGLSLICGGQCWDYQNTYRKKSPRII